MPALNLRKSSTTSVFAQFQSYSADVDVRTCVGINLTYIFDSALNLCDDG